MNKFSLRGELVLSFDKKEEQECITLTPTGKRVLNCDFKTEQGYFIKLQSWNPDIIDGFVNNLKVELTNYKISLNTWKDLKYTNIKGEPVLRKDWSIYCLELDELESNEQKTRDKVKASRAVNDNTDIDKAVSGLNWELDLDDDKPQETLSDAVDSLKDLM